MDFESLKNQVSNLTLYDLKAGVRKVQNGKVEWLLEIHKLTGCSCYESHRDGVQSTSKRIPKPSLLNCSGQGSYKCWPLGCPKLVYSINIRTSIDESRYFDDGDCTGNSQLVRCKKLVYNRADDNSQQLNEIMPMIYKRFTDKTAEEWRQIYKVSETPSMTCYSDR